MTVAALAEKHVASYTLLIDGQPVAQEFADRVREVRVVSSLASPDVCTAKILFPKPRKAGDPWAIDRMPFEIGKNLQVKLGDKGSTTPSALFTGDIVTIEPEYGESGVQVQIRALDAAHKLFRARHVRSFQNQTVSDVVSKVCGEAGLPVQCDASGGPLDYVQQSNETDWDFITRLGDRIGFEMVVIGGRAKFRKPANDPAPVQLEYPQPLIKFHPRVTAIQQVDSVRVLAFDPKTKSVIDSTKSTPALLPNIGIKRDAVRANFKGDKILVATQPVADAQQAGQVAQGLLDRMSNQYVTADGLAAGNPKIRAGATLEIKGVGTRFGGTYRVHTAIHSLKGGAVYETHFTNAPNYTIAGMLGGGNGSGGGAPSFGSQLVLAKVTNNNDPDAMGRVRVWFPALGDGNEGTWARVVGVSAGKERGMMMMPQPDEEVLVGFEHGDVARPYVIGSLFNGKDTPGEQIAAKDGSFGLRSDEQLVTNSKKATELTSEDTFAAKSAKAMTLTSDQTLDVKATQNGSFKADQGLELKGGMQVTISTDGSQLKIQAPSGMLEISAANLKLSATGMVQISGSQIMLG
jgi:phage protein D/phage baseplate assembly protein gpV